MILAIDTSVGTAVAVVEADGVVLAGLSAGAMCWLEGGVTTSSGAPEPTPGLGLLPGSLSVHADTEPRRRAVYLAAVADGTLPPGWIADDGVGLLFRDMALERIVSARPGARAARADLVDGAVVQTPIEPELIAPAPRGIGRLMQAAPPPIRNQSKPPTDLRPHTAGTRGVARLRTAACPGRPAAGLARISQTRKRDGVFAGDWRGAGGG